MVHAERYGGIIEHACDLSGRIGKLLFDDSSSDVTLVVEGESLPAHRAILGASSEYFRALLLGETKESTQSEVVLKGVPVRGFKMLMKYIYTGRVELEGIDDTIVLESIELANLYGFEELQLILCAHLVTILSVDNFCVIFETAHRLQFKKLIDACRSYTVGRQLAILQSDAFCELSGSAVIEMISDDSFSVEEIEIFAAVARWCAKRPAGTECSDVLGSVRLPLIGITDLLSTVMESGLIAREVILDAVRTKKSQPANLNFRALILPGVNLADPNAGACRLKQDRSEISDKINPSYEFEPLPSWPLPISFNLKEGLIVALKEPYFINRIDFRIPDGVRIAYEIEVSVDLMIWTRVIDHRRYLCGGYQFLVFEPRAARFIRLRGRRDVNFQVLALNVFYAATRGAVLINGLGIPTLNIARETNGTLFGFERNQEGSEDKVFIRADTTEWMTHEIGVDCILIMFPRPFVVGSLRMLLDENDSRAYKYYIETSEGTRNWKRIADHTANFCRSWQMVTFDAHPVLFIRIVGTASSVDKYFSFSRFECPAPAEVGAKSLT